MKRTIAFALAAVVTAALLMLWGFSPSERAILPQDERLLLITDDDTGWFFLQLRQGAQAACQEADVLLRIQVLPKEDALLQAGNLKADKAILFILNEQVRKAAQQQLETTATPYRLIWNGDAGTIHMEEKGGAELLSRIIPQNHTLSVVYGKQDTITTQRMEGALNVLKDAVPVFLPDKDALPRDILFTRACLALDDVATAYMAAKKESGLLPASLLLFGYDTGDSRVKDLESGNVYAMMMPAPYTLGYQAAQTVLSGQEMPSPLGRIVTKRDMFASRNVRVVFPLMQTD